MNRRVDAPTEELVREPAVAGSFYPGSPDRLASLVRDLFAAADRLPGVADRAAAGTPAGLLVPHAGLAYSGVTAAAAWRQLMPAPGTGPGALPVTVVLLGTNHAASWLDGIGIWPAGGWRTPLGTVPVDEALASEIERLGAPFAVDTDAHGLEHSIEVQLPLLQFADRLARFVPLAVSCGTGPRAVDVGRRLGELIAGRPSDAGPIVLAISTDMAHYPAVAASERVTSLLLPSILSVDAAGLADRETAVRLGGTRGLACGMCGIEPAVLGLAALATMGARCTTALAASTSADAGGPADRTVGYLAVRFDR
jgi:hypothetical protein